MKNLSFVYVSVIELFFFTETLNHSKEYCLGDLSFARIQSSNLPSFHFGFYDARFDWFFTIAWNTSRCQCKFLLAHSFFSSPRSPEKMGRA